MHAWSCAGAKQRLGRSAAVWVRRPDGPFAPCSRLSHVIASRATPPPPRRRWIRRRRTRIIDGVAVVQRRTGGTSRALILSFYRRTSMRMCHLYQFLEYETSEELETQAVISSCIPTPAGSAFDNPVTLTFDLLASLAKILPWSICVASLVLIARVVFLLERVCTHAQTDTLSHRRH